MTEEKNPNDIPGLLVVDLETYIILPFQIAHKDEQRAFNAEEFRKLLEGSDWKGAENIHEPDRIAGKDLDEEALKRIRYQAYNYFHPFVRSFWYDSNLVKRFRHRKLNTLRTQFFGWSAPIEFDAVADLYHFLPDIGVLVLHLKAKKRLPLRQAQDCLDRLRRIYPPCIRFDQDKENPAKNSEFPGHFPDLVELLDADNKPIGHYANGHIADLLARAKECEEKQTCSDENNRPAHQLLTHSHILAGHWAALLEPLGTNDYQVQQLGDDRAALASKINLFPAKEIPLIDCIDRGNQIRLCFADAAGSDRLPYAQRYLAQFEERFCYDRFWYRDGESRESPSRIMNCGYAFTYLGAGDDGYFTNEFDGAPVAFRHIYVPMSIIAHFQKAALLVASRRLADLSPYDHKGKPQELDSVVFEAMEENFIAFTQTYWFNEITPQEQGIELFDMWRRELRLPVLYQEHRQELQDIVAFINGREEARQTRAATNLNWFALVFALISVGLAFLGVLTGVMGMNPLPEDAEEAARINPEVIRVTHDAFGWLGYALPLKHILFAMAFLIAIPFVSMICRYIADRRKRSR